MNKIWGKPFTKGNVPWNKGLTKEDPRVMKYVIKMSLFKKGKHMSPKTEFKKGQSLGVNHPRWKGGFGNEDYRERRRFRSSMQKLVFERDDYTCQTCGVRGVDLQVNHKKSWVDYPELRFNMNNCETLCAKCHYFLTFGRTIPENIQGWGHNLLRRVNP